ncbi:MAG TPA: isopenicillin N synthase family oxygenase [Rhodospirillales bacterium]|nr:isopenicillin N synthase family oxygenase [Rhodospirillales bacterium]
MSHSLPLIDISELEFSDSRGRRSVDAALHEALRDIGFAYVEGHGIADEHIKELNETCIDFFSLTPEEKKSYTLNKWHRGYLAPEASTIVTSSVANVTKPNQSESFLALSEVNADGGEEENPNPLDGPNQWPQELPRMEAVCKTYMRDMRMLSIQIVHSIARGLGIDEDWFDRFFKCPTEFLRLLHYWPQEEEDGLYGAAPHTDYGFITLVAQDDVGGLEVRDRDGSWFGVPPIDGTFVLNVADILSFWTGGIFISTPHRVKNITGRERYSQPYFFDPSMETLVSPIPGLHEIEAFKAVNYGNYLMERLDKNYDYRK